MAVDMFLKIDGCDGESHISGHEDEIDVLAFSWGMTQSGDMHLAGGGGSGKVNVQDMSVTKYLDKASTVLMQKCCSGKHFPTAVLLCRKAGGDSTVDYFKVSMEEVLVTSVSEGGGGGEDKQTENISLSFAKVKVEFTPQAADGSAEGGSELGWDIRGNQEM
jgi:type VI secretion system secreted protein Hcp